MKRSTLWGWFVVVALAALSGATLAQAPVEISFYYPVAVGGPITKLIDTGRGSFRCGPRAAQLAAFGPGGVAWRHPAPHRLCWSFA